MPVGARKIAFSVRWKIKKVDWVIREKAFVLYCADRKSLTLTSKVNDIDAQYQ